MSGHGIQDPAVTMDHTSEDHHNFRDMSGMAAGDAGYCQSGLDHYRTLQYGTDQGTSCAELNDVAAVYQQDEGFQNLDSLLEPYLESQKISSHITPQTFQHDGDFQDQNASKITTEDASSDAKYETFHTQDHSSSRELIGAPISDAPRNGPMDMQMSDQDFAEISAFLAEGQCLQSVTTCVQPQTRPDSERPPSNKKGVSTSGRDEEFASEPEPHSHLLRSAFREAGPCQTTWMDLDRSGNFDPNGNKPRAPRCCAGRRKGPRNTLPSEAADARRLTKTQDRLYNAACRVNGSSFVFTIGLSSDEGKTLLTRGLDNWPDDEWSLIEPDDDEEDEIFDPTRYSKGYKLRARETLAVPAVAKPDLSGHPAARGCWTCYELGMLDNTMITAQTKINCCSLLHDETEWPCQTCHADGEECELITPPKVKRTCEGCKKRKSNCSYARTSCHIGPCLECKQAGHRCIAGPNKSAINRRINIDNPPKPKKRDTSCTECVRKGSGSIIRRGTGNKATSTCRSCASNTPLCSPRPIVEPPPDILKKRKAQEQDASELLNRQISQVMHTSSKQDSTGSQKRAKPCEPRVWPGQATTDPRRPRETPEAYLNTSAQDIIRSSDPLKTSEVDIQFAVESVRPVHPKFAQQQQQRRPLQSPIKVIITKLCHPVSFNHEDASGKTPCHFCHISSYRVLGLGPRETTVEDHKHRSITEKANGHRAEGSDPTRICVACTMNLMRFLVHGNHTFNRIDESLIDFDFNEKFIRLLDGSTRTTDLWCSICPTPAEYACGERVEGNVLHDGCGMMLCSDCYGDLTQIHDNEFLAFLGALPLECTERRPFGLRADAELLQLDGELSRFLIRMNT